MQVTVLNFLTMEGEHGTKCSQLQGFRKPKKTGGGGGGGRDALCACMTP